MTATMMKNRTVAGDQKRTTGLLLACYPVEWPRIGSAPASALASWRDKTPTRAAEEKSEFKKIKAVRKMAWPLKWQQKRKIGKLDGTNGKFVWCRTGKMGEDSKVNAASVTTQSFFETPS